MPINCHRRAMILLLAFVTPGIAGVVDRVAVVIGKKVVTESEVVDDLRLTEFLNNAPLNTGPAARREEAEHLVDQELLRTEMDLSGFSQPAAGQADVLLGKFRKQQYRSDAEYRAALEKYGVSETELKQRLLWQYTAIQFTDFRFRDPAPTDGAATDGNAPQAGVDRQMEAWLKQARSNTTIVIKPEAFQ